MKQKSSSSAKKRFKKTGKKGQVNLKGSKSCKNHLLTNKSKRQKKLHMSGMMIDKSEVKRIKSLLPNL